MSYAVVDLGGKQYRVEEGSVITVDRLQAEQGDKVTLRPVMFRGDDVVLDAKADTWTRKNHFRATWRGMLDQADRYLKRRKGRAT